jgi:aquaporin related protein
MAGSGIREKLGVEEITRGIWKALLAEFLGNLLLNFFGCASCVGAGDIGKTPVLVSLTFGLVIMAIVQVRISPYGQLVNLRHGHVGKRNVLG